MPSISRKGQLSEKIVFVDGLPGCGKTLFNRVLSTFKRVELLSYTYEVEFYCALHFLGKFEEDSAAALIKLQTDLKLYNLMMSRDTNFRPSDLSGIFNDPNPDRYLRRLFSSGDQSVLDSIKKDRPVLNFAVHNLLPFSRPIWSALGANCIFVQVVRHPLYMIKQQALNFENLTETARDFTIYFEYQSQEVPYYASGWEQHYVNSNPIEKAIYFINFMKKLNKEMSKEFTSKFGAKILTIPFEAFVLDPIPWTSKLAQILETSSTESTIRVMGEQNVPRSKVADGIDLDIYRRCGWVPGDKSLTEAQELSLRRQEFVSSCSAETIEILDSLSKSYSDMLRTEHNIDLHQ